MNNTANSRESTHGLGYFLELMAARHLREQHGITCITTILDSSEERRNQLEAVGLAHPESEYPLKHDIKTYMAGLRRGVQRAVRKHRQEKNG